MRPTTAARLAALLPPAVVTIVVGGVYLGVATAVGGIARPGVAAVAATAAAALAALPAYVQTRRLTDGLVGRTRPVAHGVFAELAALPRASTGVPDLARAVEVVGRGLGAGVCTLTVRRPGLRDRTYTWALPGQEQTEARLEVPLRHGTEDVGTLAVDRVTVGATDAERQELVEAIASNLGVVLQAVRSGIELERQLRAALAHAVDIAAAG
ncbi:MAG TPA: hypothetical protein VHF92_11510, partial [Geodermatophilus sp.]|nr:hypothetical protein [Geodermatophilus sp.]